MRSPSVAGVDEASELALLILPLPPGSGACQRIEPSFVSTLMSQRSLPSFDADWRKSASPQTTGDEWPMPGIAVFHSMFSLSVNVTGTFLSSTSPVPLGPRKRGQLPAAATAAADRRTARAKRRGSFSKCRVMVGESHKRREQRDHVIPDESRGYHNKAAARPP